MPNCPTAPPTGYDVTVIPVSFHPFGPVASISRITRYIEMGIDMAVKSIVLPIVQLSKIHGKVKRPIFIVFLGHDCRLGWET